MLTRNLMIATCLTMLTAVAYAQDGSKVIRTEATGAERIYAVGDCIWKHNRDINGGVTMGYDLSVTYCKEYQTYQAIQRGSGWRAKYEPISEPRYSNRIKVSSKSFIDIYGAQDVFDEMKIQFSLKAQCDAMRDSLEDIVDRTPCH